jgi:hypothetical protein
MSDWSLLSGDPSEGGVVTSTESDDGFAMLNQGLTRAVDKKATVATWLGTQVATGSPSKSHLQSKDASLDASKGNDSMSTPTTPAQYIPNSMAGNNLPLTKVVGEENASDTRTKLIAGVDISTIQHFVIEINSDVFYHTSSEISAKMQAKFQRNGIISMLYYILWANVFLLEKPNSKFWNQVKDAASAKIPKDLNCWVLVKGDTDKVSSVLKKLNLLVRNQMNLFKAKAFYFSFKEGVFSWEYQADGLGIHDMLIKEGIPTSAKKSFKRVSSQVLKLGYS